MITLSHTCSAVSLRYFLQSLLYLSVSVEPEFVDQVVQPLAGKVVLHLAKYSFYGIEHWTVRDIVHRQDVKFSVVRFDLFTFVNF